MTRESSDVFQSLKVTTGLFAGITLPPVTKALRRKTPAPKEQPGAQQRLNQSILKSYAVGIRFSDNPTFNPRYINRRPPKSKKDDRAALGLKKRRLKK